MGMYNNAGQPPVQQQPPNMMHQPPNQPPIHQGQQQGQQQAPPNTQASLPSPLYPWMRSQFGKLGLFHSNFIFLLIKLTPKDGRWKL